jgi:hypothetical protein
MPISLPLGWARVIALGAALAAAVPAATEIVPGRNVNMVAGQDWPRGDPFLQRQNEGSVAVSTRNWLHLQGAGNDYRTVDLASALTGGRVVGDAWHGIFRSVDGGNTWRSTLLPGYPLDTSPEGLASPLKGYDAGADPLVRAGTNGLFFHSGIVFDRTPQGRSALFVARFIDLNNKENGDPVRYLDTSLIDTGSAGQFIDKPWMFVDRPRAGALSCTIQVPAQGGTIVQSAAAAPAPITQSFPAGNIYVSYTVFLGNESQTRTKLMLARSRDCGATWTRTKVSEGYPVNQGSALAVEPATGAVYLAWRQFKTDHVPDAILVTKSVDGGATFTKASEVTLLTPFEQGTTPVSPRINSYPSLIAHGGRVYLAYAEKGLGPGGDARVVITSSSDGLSWTAPTLAVPDPARGHQFFPALAVVAGRLIVTYYGLREDHTFGVLTPAGGGQYTESRTPAGDLAPPDPQPAKVFTDFLMEVPPSGFGFGPLLRRHTVDVWVADADLGPSPVFHAVRASEYVFGSRPGSSVIEQLQFNPPNLKMFQLGTVPFFSDYIDVGVLPFRPTPAGWVHDDAPSAAAHIVWTDNRDVRPPLDGDWTHYTPVSSPAVGGVSKFDPSQPVPACVVGQTGMRNQNLYTARVTRGLYVGSPGNTKPLGAIQRAFVAFAQNARDAAASYRFSIAAPPPGGQASFLQSGLLTTLDVLVPARSTVSRSVFVTSTDPAASVTVNIVEITAPGGAPVPGGHAGQVVLNADHTTPDISNPDISNPDISNPDISNAEVHNPDISNPDISNPDISNPDISNPDISNPDISNYEVANPDISNPDISNPDISNPDISNPDISNPDISNPDISNGAVSDTLWTATNNGNTASSYTVKVLKDGDPPPGFKLQLIVHGIYTTPVAQACALKVQTQNVVIANLPNPPFATLADFTDPDTSNPAAVTVNLAPGASARITLRVFDPNRFDAVTWTAAEHVVPVVVAHAANTGETQPPFAIGRPILLFATPPTNTETGTAIVPAVQVKALDGDGDPLVGVNVTVALGSNPGGGTLSGTTTQVTDALGIATFPGLAIDAAGIGYTLTASAPGTLPATSVPFDVAATISFERYPDGTPACASCALTNEFASRGVVFSFFSGFTTATEAGLFDSATYDPPGGPPNHSVTAAIQPPPTGGFANGTVVMEYAGLPTTGVFRLRGNDSIPVYPVAAFGPGLTPIPPAQITRSNVSTYASPGGFLFREETVTVTDPGGVARVELDMNGFIVLVDDLRLQ